MKYEVALLGLASIASARDTMKYWNKLGRREVPQEHSHEAILRAADAALKLNNPLEIQDAVFALLGNAAAATGAPNVQNLDCLQQIIADQAFTNAKAAGDLDAMANAILFRALEKNTLQVGLASPLCNEAAINPEIAAIQQHQDPASPEASGNAQIELNVAIQLASIGADPALALTSGTFAPGELGDPTAAGNTCNDAEDAIGCIISLNLLVPAVSLNDIQVAVAGAGGAAAVAGGAADVAVGADAAACASSGAGAAASADNAGANADAATGTVNVQAFSGALGGPAPPVQSTAGADRPFEVNGATFLNAGAAIQRSCAVQKNACSNAANSGALDGGTAQCDAQEADCLGANSLKRRRAALRRRGVAFDKRQAALDFGSCGSPAIEFGENLGRSGLAFRNVNFQEFNQGAALNIQIIGDFTCNRLASSCQASDETVAACKAATQDAVAAQNSVQDVADRGVAADVFNAALGV